MILESCNIGLNEFFTEEGISELFGKDCDVSLRFINKLFDVFKFLLLGSVISSFFRFFGFSKDSGFIFIGSFGSISIFFSLPEAFFSSITELLETEGVLKIVGCSKFIDFDSKLDVVKTLKFGVANGSC